jgi:HEAT repeat protein
VAIEQDFNDRIVIRRGLPWLGLLGNDVLVDTGYTAISDVERDKREELQGLVHWELDNRLGGVVEREEFVNHLDSAAWEGLLLCQTGQIKAGIERLAEALKSNNDQIKRAAQSALNQTAQTVPQAALPHLLDLLKQYNDNSDPDGDVRRAVADALGQVAQADHSLAQQTLAPLLNLLKQLNASNDPDRDATHAVAAALGQVAQADHSLAPQTLPPLLDLLRQFNASNDPYGYVRSAVAAALGQIAQADPNARNQVFGLLTNYDGYVRDGVTPPLAELLFDLAEEEKKAGRGPLRWLFDHLEGRQSLLPGGNANTHAVYRTVVVGALARWLASDKPEVKADQERLRQRLAQMRDTDRRVHLRIAAWNVFVEAAKLREEQQRGEN